MMSSPTAPAANDPSLVNPQDRLTPIQKAVCIGYMKIAYDKRYPDHDLPDAIKAWYWREAFSDWSPVTPPSVIPKPDPAAREVTLRIGALKENIPLRCHYDDSSESEDDDYYEYKYGKECEARQQGAPIFLRVSRDQYDWIPRLQVVDQMGFEVSRRYVSNPSVPPDHPRAGSDEQYVEVIRKWDDAHVRRISRHNNRVVIYLIRAFAYHMLYCANQPGKYFLAEHTVEDFWNYSLFSDNISAPWLITQLDRCRDRPFLLEH